MKISNVKQVLIIGAGGTGSFLIPAITRYLFSQKYKGNIIIADGDSYSESNIERQLFNSSFINKNKADYQRSVTVSHIPALTDQVTAITEYLSKDDIYSIINEGTIIINCVDNRAARKHVEDRCNQLNDVVHICCGNEEVTGQVQIHIRSNGQDLTDSIYEDAPTFNDGDDDRAEMSCEEISELEGGGQIISANMLAASLALNSFIQCVAEEFGENYFPCRTVYFDTRFNTFSRTGEKTLSI